MKLKVGDRISIISPSWCGSQHFPHVYEKGIENLKLMGFHIKEYSFTNIQGTAKQKAQDLTNAFLDTDTQAIIVTIGGDDCTFLLKHLDIELLKKHKKPIMGYSDATALFTVFTQYDIPCYYGPSIMAGFSHMHLYPDWFSYTEKTLKGEKLPFKPFTEYSDSYKDWSNGVIDYNEKQQNDGFHFLTNLEAEGELFGGCIDVLEFLKGTQYFPKTEFFENKILFLETSEDKPKPQQVKYFLRNYGFMGVLQSIQGILFGRARDYTIEEKKELEEVILQVLQEFNVKIPVVTNVDFGHTDPKFILKYGEKVQIKKDSLLRI